LHLLLSELHLASVHSSKRDIGFDINIKNLYRGGQGQGGDPARLVIVLSSTRKSIQNSQCWSWIIPGVAIYNRATQIGPRHTIDIIKLHWSRKLWANRVEGR